ncbi:MAG: hypothetical protein OEV87_12280 [Phycisphaerae bacterium]|nr:hypothetical protein [Phycisphaerae bacterium]
MSQTQVKISKHYQHCLDKIHEGNPKYLFIFNATGRKEMSEILIQETEGKTDTKSRAIRTLAMKTLDDAEQSLSKADRLNGMRERLTEIVGGLDDRTKCIIETLTALILADNCLPGFRWTQDLLYSSSTKEETMERFQKLPDDDMQYLFDAYKLALEIN